MTRPVCLLLLAPLLFAPVSAQSGDKRGELQPALAEHFVVPPAPVRTPEEEAATFTLVPGFRIELVAADPLVGDPIALQFGPDGRLWVIEMRGYLPDAESQRKREPVGVVAVLEDTDGDGRYDRRTVFADRLVMPRALAFAGDGLLVAEPPNLWFFRDTNGDGIADEKRAVAGDYGEIGNPEHSANGLMRALDNWIYSANFTARFRWQPGGTFAREVTINRGQWGITQDDAGRLYYNSNSDPLRHDAIPSAYLQRNPAFNASGANLALVPGNLRIWPGRATPGVNRGDKTPDATGRIASMTAASGPVVYRGGLFPAEFHGDAFVPNPSANLIKRIKLTERDGVLTGANAYVGREFLTSTDERFRPVNLYNGPDGALYVVDLYRGILPHRNDITSFLRQQIEERGLARGTGFGRIWRIFPDGAPKANIRPGLANASAAALVAKLGDANGWVRDTAQRLLVERRDSAAVAALRAMAIDTRKSANARLHALWTLEGMEGGALDRATVGEALSDPESRVAAAAVRLSESFLREEPADSELAARVSALVKSRVEPAVRLQLALSLVEARTPATDAALRELVVRAGSQPLLADAVVSGLAGRENALVESLVHYSPAAARSGAVLRYATSAILKSGDAARIERVLGIVGASVTPEWARIPMLSGVRHFLPKGPDGVVYPATLPAEPTPLVALAADPDLPPALIARQLLRQLRWPGKPGMSAPVSKARAATAARAEPFSEADLEELARTPGR